MGSVEAYRELAAPPVLRAHVACVWVSHDAETRVLPDGCVDVVLFGGRLLVAGPATTATVAGATPGRPRCGVRFRVGAAGAALGVPAGELLDRGVALAELWGRAGARREERAAAAPTSAQALAVLTAGLARRLPPPHVADPVVREAVLALRRDPGTPVAALARRVALGERQLRRRFERAVGYGPATLVRVQRFQRFLALAGAHPGATLARLAADAGYADQAHLVRECRRLSGLAPSALLAAGAAPAGERSEAFKPEARGSGRLTA
jgi:AraC-like DNA-binding protein